MDRRLLLYVATMLITSWGAAILVAQQPGKADAGNNRGASIQDGWRQEIEIPEVKDPSGDTFLRSAKVELWLECGWLCVRRMAADEALEWQVVLAQPTSDAAPAIQVDKTGGLDIAYETISFARTWAN